MRGRAGQAQCLQLDTMIDPKIKIDQCLLGATAGDEGMLVIAEMSRSEYRRLAVTSCDPLSASQWES